MEETRNVLIESARIARGNVKPLEELYAKDHDMLFMPGGFGAAKNLSDFAINGNKMVVYKNTTRILNEFHVAKKYIGLCCISPIVAAKVFGTKEGGGGPKLTLGCHGKDWPYSGAIDVAASFGNGMVKTDVNQVCHDEIHKIVSAPAYMKGTASPSDVFEKVKMMVDTVANSYKANIREHPVTLIVDVEVKPNRLDDFKKAIKIDAEGSRLEDGCYRFDVL